MQFQGCGAGRSFKWLFLAKTVGYFENRKVELSCDFSLFHLLTFIRSILMYWTEYVRIDEEGRE